MDDGIKFMILFFWCIGMMFFMNNQTLFIIQFILFLIACGWFMKPYINFDIKQFIKKLYRPNSYKLTEEETPLWESIIKKAMHGFYEYTVHVKKYPDEICPPWIGETLTDDELKLLYKLHNMFYEKGWYIVDPIGPSQVQYIMYEDVKDKVKYEKLETKTIKNI